MATGAADAAHITADVPAGTAGSATTITVTVRDANNNVRSNNDDSGLLSVAITGGNTASPTLASQGSGIYTATYTPTVAGTDNVTIELTGTGISGNPFTSTVGAGTATTLQVSGLPGAPVQATAYDFAVTLRDAFGNVATGYAGTVEFAISPGTGTVPDAYTFMPGDAERIPSPRARPSIRKAPRLLPPVTPSTRSPGPRT